MEFSMQPKMPKNLTKYELLTLNCFRHVHNLRSQVKPMADDDDSDGTDEFKEHTMDNFVENIEIPAEEQVQSINDPPKITIDVKGNRQMSPKHVLLPQLPQLPYQYDELYCKPLNTLDKKQFLDLLTGIHKLKQPALARDLIDDVFVSKEFENFALDTKIKLVDELELIVQKFQDKWKGPFFDFDYLKKKEIAYLLSVFSRMQDDEVNEILDELFNIPIKMIKSRHMSFYFSNDKKLQILQLLIKCVDFGVFDELTEQLKERLCDLKTFNPIKRYLNFDHLSYNSVDMILSDIETFSPEDLQLVILAVADRIQSDKNLRCVSIGHQLSDVADVLFKVVKETKKEEIIQALKDCVQSQGKINPKVVYKTEWNLILKITKLFKYVPDKLLQELDLEKRLPLMSKEGLKETHELMKIFSGLQNKTVTMKDSPRYETTFEWDTIEKIWNIINSAEIPQGSFPNLNFKNLTFSFRTRLLELLSNFTQEELNEELTQLKKHLKENDNCYKHKNWSEVTQLLVNAAGGINSDQKGGFKVKRYIKSFQAVQQFENILDSNLHKLFKDEVVDILGYRKNRRIKEYYHSKILKVLREICTKLKVDEKTCLKKALSHLTTKDIRGLIILIVLCSHEYRESLKEVIETELVERDDYINLLWNLLEYSFLTDHTVLEVALNMMSTVTAQTLAAELRGKKVATKDCQPEWPDEQKLKVTKNATFKARLVLLEDDCIVNQDTYLKLLKELSVLKEKKKKYLMMIQSSE